MASRSSRPRRSRAARWPRPGVRAAPALLLVVAVAACGSVGQPVRSSTAAPLAPPTATVQSAAVTPPCDPVPGWSCEQSARFAAVEKKIDGLPGPDGHLAVSFTDRTTGRTWTAGDVTHPGWTASTIKLAIATDLLEGDRTGRSALSGADRDDMAAMLHSSDNEATDRLWKRHGGDDMLARFRDRYGMGGVAFQPGFTTSTYWGFVKCTTADLASLGRHILDRTDPADRAHLVTAMRGVAENQRWGVWAAGAGNRPGDKNGWSQEKDAYGEHWVTDTVGFAGPDERYVVAIMYQVPPQGSLDDGVHAVSDVTALLFGAPTPADVTVPEPDG
ncbi:hypothetical protein [Pseudonocardia sediminis]|uniref:hypothetical protein n=1 Tax=Pseudonocardia sediminis TaxID=1397368 RepID=UPI001029C944|nr:hypothetical protein [Pseudonocardia sediminis]